MMLIVISCLLSLLTGVIIGVKLNKWNLNLQYKILKMKQIKKANEVYLNLLNSIINRKTIFKTRINNSIILGSKLEQLGDVDVVYLLDKNEVSIFQNQVCVVNDKEVDKTIIEKIITTIQHNYKEKIHDVVEVMGVLLSRSEFEKAINDNISQMKKRIEKQEKDSSNIDNIIETNEKKFDIDEILDKINQVGINNLSPEEKKFLQNYNKNE